MAIDHALIAYLWLTPNSGSSLRDTKEDPTGSLMLVHSQSPGGFVDRLGRLECAVSNEIDLRTSFGGLERIGTQGG